METGVDERAPRERQPGRLEVRQDPDGVVLVMAGEVDMAVVHAADDEIGLLLADPPEALDVDLSGVTFMDSSGVGALVKLYNRTLEHGGRMSLQGPTAPVIRLLRICGLDEVFSVDGAAAPSTDGQD